MILLIVSLRGRLLDFLNTIAIHEKYVEKLDEMIAPILNGVVPLVVNED